MAAHLNLRFVISAPDISLMPQSRTEVAVVGRSNVGKSSLINSLGNRKSIAKVSKTPGRTRLLNCFDVDGTEKNPSGALLVDCPGYGFASAPATMRRSWQKMMEDYLMMRKELAMIMLLVDGEIGPTKLDILMLEWLRGNELNHSIIATKHDKVKSSVRDKRKRELAAKCDLLPGDISWVSAANGTGIDRLCGLVRLWLTGP